MLITIVIITSIIIIIIWIAVIIIIIIIIVSFWSLSMSCLASLGMHENPYLRVISKNLIEEQRWRN